MPDDHIDPDTLSNVLVVHIWAGHTYYESHRGGWIDDSLLDDLLSVFPDQVEPLLMDFPEVEDAIEQSRDGESIFTVTIHDPEIIVEPGGWTNAGYSSPDYYLGCGEVTVERNN